MGELLLPAHELERVRFEFTRQDRAVARRARRPFCLDVYAAFVVWLVLLGRRKDAHALATFILDCIVLVTRLARDPRVPRRRKLLLLALGGYLALPFDRVPDFIPVAGQLDDAFIVRSFAG